MQPGGNTTYAAPEKQMTSLSLSGWPKLDFWRRGLCIFSPKAVEAFADGAVEYVIAVAAKVTPRYRHLLVENLSFNEMRVRVIREIEVGKDVGPAGWCGPLRC